MDIHTVDGVAEKVSLSKEIVAKYCREGRFKGAELRGRMWLIPDDAVRQFELDHKGYAPGRPRKSGDRWVLWRERGERVPELAKAAAFALRAPALLPKNVSRKAAEAYVSLGRTKTERAARRAMMEALYDR